MLPSVHLSNCLPPVKKLARLRPALSLPDKPISVMIDKYTFIVSRSRCYAPLISRTMHAGLRSLKDLGDLKVKDSLKC